MYIQRIVKRMPFVFLWALISCSLSGGSLRAVVSGETKRVLRGMVVDHAGNLVPNFIVEIRARASGSSISVPEKQPRASEVQTDRNGQFSVPLAPGSYE